MQADLRTYLWDISGALEELAEYTDGKTVTDYLADRKTRLAVERVFEIVGEAMSKMIHRFPETKARIDDARSIADFRNVIAHEYRDVKDDTVWKIIVDSAPLLKTQIDEWLNELNEAERGG